MVAWSSAVKSWTSVSVTTPCAEVVVIVYSRGRYELDGGSLGIDMPFEQRGSWWRPPSGQCDEVCEGNADGERRQRTDEPQPYSQGGMMSIPSRYAHETDSASTG